MGKQSRSKPSRKERKETRTRRGRAIEHGLPAPVDAQPRRPAAFEPKDSESSSRSSSLPLRTSSSAHPEKPSFWQGLMGLPFSLKLLVAATIALVLIGLYQRYAEKAELERGATFPKNTAETSAVIAVPASSGSSQ